MTRCCAKLMDRMAAPIRLVALGSETLRAYPLAKRQITVGSAPDSDIAIEHESVSRRHAVIERGMGGFSVRDLNSTNGTRLNGQRIAGVRRLAAGDELQFGNARFAVMKSPRRRRFFGVSTAAMIAALLIGAGLGAAHYFNLDLDRLLARTKPAPSSPHPANAPAPASAIPGTVRHDGAAAVDSENKLPASSSTAGAVAPWLSAVNEYRTMAGVPPVRENPSLSAGDFAHARYLVKNGRSPEDTATEGADAHNEQPGNPWFSVEGRRAAHSADVDQWWGTSRRDRPPPRWAIEQWIASTWHRMAILNPRLSEVGYGEFCENGNCAAVLDVLSGLGTARLTQAVAPAPVRFPPENATVAMDSFGNEWPDPLTSCRGYTVPAGLPVTLQLGSMVPARLEAYSLRRDSSTQILEACGFDAATYFNPVSTDQRAGREALTELGAVAIVPRKPLQPGTYHVEMTVNGQSYAWNFSVRP